MAAKKKIQKKGAHHAFDWKILDNLNVQVEMGWENEKEAYRSSILCKKYVKPNNCIEKRGSRALSYQVATYFIKNLKR